MKTAGADLVLDLLENPKNVDARLLMELLRHIDSAPSEMRKKMLNELIRKIDLLPEPVRNAIIKDLLKQSGNLDLSPEQLQVICLLKKEFASNE